MFGRVAIVWAALVLSWIAAATFRAEVLAPRFGFDAWRAIESVLGGALGVALVVGACRVLDRRTLGSLGFRLTRADLVAFGVGAGLWTGLAAVGLVVGAAAGLFTVTLGPPSWMMVGWILLQIGLVFSYEALPEELALRGYIYTNLAERVPRWLAVLGQAVLFMLWAFTLVALLDVVGVGTGWSITLDRAILFLTFGISLALLRLWTGSLWASIGFHLAFQVGMGLLSLDRLTVVSVPSSDIGSVGIVLWLFGIVLGGAVALVGLIRKERRAKASA
ncbi:MAG: CPBP family intramembrane glutamic endopeptidase [Gemmatimonadota bacterium]